MVTVQRELFVTEMDRMGVLFYSIAVAVAVDFDCAVATDIGAFVVCLENIFKGVMREFSR